MTPSGPSQPFEPQLSDDELIGVRGLLQERYNPDLRVTSPKYFAGAAASLADDPPSRTSSVREDKQPAAAPHTNSSSPVPGSGGGGSGGVEANPPAAPPPEHSTTAQLLNSAAAALLDMTRSEKPGNWWNFDTLIGKLMAHEKQISEDQAGSSIPGAMW